jgi:hypothetical protein
MLKWMRLLGLFWAFGLWFELGICSKSSLRFTYSKLFLIDNIVTSSGLGIPDFHRYKIGCVQQGFGPKYNIKKKIKKDTKINLLSPQD